MAMRAPNRGTVGIFYTYLGHKLLGAEPLVRR